MATASLPPSPSYEADERVAAQESASLAQETWRSLCVQHASAFAAAERRSATVRSALHELLREASEGVPPSVQRVGRALDPGYFESDDVRPASELLAELENKIRLRRRTLMQHATLLELLELPSLMDACVRSALYEDALSLAALANTLERRHFVDLSQQKQKGDVLAGVIMEIRRREIDLRSQLIHRLRGDVSMPNCLEIVTALRTLNGIELERRGWGWKGSNAIATERHTETNDNQDYLEGVHAAMEMRLQVDFLEARDIWLEGGIIKIGSAQAVAAAASSSLAMATLEKGSSAQAEQILDGIERYRSRCFEIVTQFLAIFRGSLAFSTSTPSSKNSNDHSHSLLSMWTSRRVQTFLTALHSNISLHIHDSATLRDALDAASFFASSMGRVGADFQSMLIPIFEPRITEIIVVYWKEGLSGMTDTLKACRDAGIAGPLFGTETFTVSDHNIDSGNDGGEIQSSRTPMPPRKLLALPPLARFLNAYLGGLNELRRCLLPCAFPAIRSAHLKLITDAKFTLQTNERAVLTPGLRGEAARLREAASRMKLEFDVSVEPYMLATLEVALGSLDYALVDAEKARIDDDVEIADAVASEIKDNSCLEKKLIEEDVSLTEEGDHSGSVALMSLAPETDVKQEEHDIVESEFVDHQSEKDDTHSINDG